MRENLDIAPGPFEDLLIVDISGTVATGYAGKLFANYGARVVNIEPPEGFPTRRLEPLLKGGCSAMHGYLNANKESVVTVDPLMHPAVSAADLILVDPQTLPPSKPLEDFDTNVCAISWFGLNGPYANYHGSDAAILALSGLMRAIGEPQGPPIIPQGYQAQMIGGLSAFNGALGFLLGQAQANKANRSAPSFCLDASIYEASMCLTDLAPINAYNNNPLPSRMGINRFPPTYPLGIWPCKDGWLGVTCLSPGQWHSFCKLLGLDDYAEIPLFQSSVSRLESADVLEPMILEALLKHSAEELFYRGQAMRIPLARVPTMDELFSVDQYVQRQAFADYSCRDETFQGPTLPFRLLKTPPVLGGRVADLGANNERWGNTDHTSNPISGVEKEASPRKEASPSEETLSHLPLQGLRIIDLSMGWAGPLAARNLADLGATVIKVESCTRFDWWRSWEATKEWIEDDGAEKSLPYNYANRNKLDITLDLESDAGRDLLLRLVADADAVVENYSGGVLPRLKLDYEHMAKVNPELVMVSMRAFGCTGPWANFRAYGSTIEHSSGLPHLSGNEHQLPVMQHVAMGDSIAGLNGTAALLTALYHKKLTGQGQFVDLSQAECLFPLAAPGILHQSVYGQKPQRFGNKHADHVPYGVFPCSGEDRWLLLEVQNNVDWQRFCDRYPQFLSFKQLSVVERREQNDKIETALVEWTQDQDAAFLMRELQRMGITAAVLNDGADLLKDPHLLARGYQQFIERDFVGRQPHPSPPWRLGVQPLTVTAPAPTLGQHNQLVLGETLGLNQAELELLAEAGVIGSKPRLK
jgi:crotonobetainyl-CoA:carnitine CoA-transferase CaiB-like acyl-CoA transferase